MSRIFEKIIKAHGAQRRERELAAHSAQMDARVIIKIHIIKERADTTGHNFISRDGYFNI
jgi:hypothetical protein